MQDLFKPLTRDERQEQSKKAWLSNKGRGTIVAATGVGSKNKSRSVKEFTELLSGNIGETLKIDNTEITEEIKKFLVS